MSQDCPDGQPIFDADYWRKRLDAAAEPHHAVFKCGLEQWQKIEEAHRAILAARIGRGDSILDAGCGWGRLLELLPLDWRGWYVGIDLSPDFIRMANERHPRSRFVIGDLRHLTGVQWMANARFDWGVLVSMRPMVKRHFGAKCWAGIEAELRKVCKRLLYLEYDPADPGSVE